MTDWMSVPPLKYAGWKSQGVLLMNCFQPVCRYLDISVEGQVQRQRAQTSPLPKRATEDNSMTKEAPRLQNRTPAISTQNLSCTSRWITGCFPQKNIQQRWKHLSLQKKTTSSTLSSSTKFWHPSPFPTLQWNGTSVPLKGWRCTGATPCVRSIWMDSLLWLLMLSEP